MTKKEVFDLGIDITTFLYEAKEAQDKDSADVANMAVDMVKGMLERMPKVRYEIWQWGQEKYLDDLGLDYGHP